MALVGDSIRSLLNVPLKGAHACREWKGRLKRRVGLSYDDIKINRRTAVVARGCLFTASVRMCKAACVEGVWSECVETVPRERVAVPSETLSKASTLFDYS